MSRRRYSRTFVGFDAPIVEVFGGAFALLLILFLIINSIADSQIYAMLDDAAEESTYKISWETGAEGFVILAFPDRLHILETNTSIPLGEICTVGSHFVDYVSSLYRQRNTQVVFAITEGGVTSMATARNCMLSSLGRIPIAIGWIIANAQLLKAVDLESIPVQIKRSITNTIDTP